MSKTLFKITKGKFSFLTRGPRGKSGILQVPVCAKTAIQWKKLAFTNYNDNFTGMDVDACPSTSAELLSGHPILPKIDEDGALDNVNSKQKIMEVLDTLEGHVEKLRKDAARLEEEKDNILSTLDAVKMLPSINDLIGLEKDEALRYLERIMDRCLTVEVKVHTQRDKSQEEALHQVNHLIDHLVMSLKADAEGARLRCVTYMNSCSSQGQGIADKHFESVLLGCTIDDQKRVKKRLHGLLKYLEKLGYVTEVD